MDYLGEKGYNMTMTCRRDCFPKGLKDYLHHETGTGKQEKARVIRFKYEATMYLRTGSVL